jgi:hypothetical protein
MKKLISMLWPLWIIGTFAHLPIFLSVSSHWDGILFSYLAETGQFSVLREWHISSGLLVHVPILWLLTRFGEYFSLVCHIASLMSLLSSATCAYLLLTRHMRLAHYHALFACSIMLTIPYLHMLMIESAIMQMVLMLCFYAGWLIYLESKKKYLRKILGLALIFLSFYHGVYLLLSLAMAAAFALLSGNNYKSSFRIVTLPAALAFLFFAAKPVLMPIDGIFSDISYNIPLILRDDTAISYAISQTWFFSINNLALLLISYSHFFTEALFKEPLLLIIFIILTAAVWLYFRPHITHELNHKAVIITSGLLFVVAVAITHGALGQLINLTDPRARYGLHAGLGIGITLVGLGLIGERLFSVSFINAFYAVLIACCLTATLHGHSLWLARGIKDAAVTQQIANSELPSSVRFYFFNDDPLHFHGLGWPYDYHERTTMLNAALHTHNLLALNTANFQDPDLTKLVSEAANYLSYYNFKTSDLSNYSTIQCTGIIKITPDSKVGIYELLGQYYILRLLSPERVAAWLANFAPVTIGYINPHTRQFCNP